MNIRALPGVTFAVIACGLLPGCLTPALETVIREPVYNFVTTQEIALREEAEHESHVVAHLPRGTRVAPIGVNSECNCWKVEALGHEGYVYNRYLDGPILFDGPGEP